MLALLLLCIAAMPVRSQELADASRGAALIESQGCAGCHHFTRQPRNTILSKSLAKLLKKHLTPARLAGALWSHAPTMWTAIPLANRAFPTLTTRQADDLIAWFAAAGYFEPPGDAKQGAKTFQTQRCSMCHAVAGKDAALANGKAAPVDRWTSLANPVDLLLAVWQHAPSMKAAMDKRTMTWPSLSIDELSDILAFVERTLAAQSRPAALVLGDPARGRTLYDMKGCLSCHKGRQTRENVPLPHSFTELAAILWNHAPMMTNLPPMLTRQEMADLAGYLWASRYFEEGGRVLRGKSVFELKHCTACHEALHSQTPFSAGVMIAALWKHSPAALARAGAKQIPWTPFLDQEMADLVAYLNIARSAALVE
jgi:cytochrome c2